VKTRALRRLPTVSMLCQVYQNRKIIRPTKPLSLDDAELQDLLLACEPLPIDLRGIEVMMQCKSAPGRERKCERRIFHADPRNTPRAECSNSAFSDAITAHNGWHRRNFQQNQRRSNHGASRKRDLGPHWETPRHIWPKAASPEAQRSFSGVRPRRRVGRRISGRRAGSGVLVGVILSPLLAARSSRSSSGRTAAS
jgi:hypothetical protein